MLLPPAAARTAEVASKTLTAVVELPWGKPMTGQMPTVGVGIEVEAGSEEEEWVDEGGERICRASGML